MDAISPKRADGLATNESTRKSRSSIMNLDVSQAFRSFSARVAEDWEASSSAFPGEVVFLQPDLIRENAIFCGMDEKHLPELRSAAQRIRESALLKALAWHCHWKVFLAPQAARLNEWPSFEEQLGAQAGSFYLLVALSFTPLLREHHRRLGVTEEVTRQTAFQVASNCGNYERGHGGKIGVYPNQLNWLRHYVHKEYFRLGRMEYWLKPFRGGVRAYRHRLKGHVVALASDGVVFDSHGFIRAGVDSNALPQGSWVSKLELGGNSVTGQLISPFGMGLKKTVSLSLDAWELVLQKDSWVLDMHIPAGGGLTPEACRESHLQAIKFFDRHFPNRRWSAYVCSSWMFNTQLEEILPPGANLVKYMQDLYLFPVPSTGQDGLWFVFLQEPLDLASAPCETSLQRSILDFLRAGNVWRGGGMFMLREHADTMGSRHYRSQWVQAEAAVLAADA